MSRADEYLVDSFKVGDYTAKIYYDTDTDGPREWDNAGHMICWHRRHSLGDKHDFKEPHNLMAHLIRECPLDDQSVRELLADMGEKCPRSGRRDCLADLVDEGGISGPLGNKIMERLRAAGMVILPLYLYDHSGITMSTSSFSDQWDSGQVGWIYITPKEIKKEWGKGPEAIQKARDYLKGEVETYDQYIRGDVYGYVIEDEKGNHMDSCWGFYGREEVEEEARDIAESYVEDTSMFKGADI